MEICLFVCMFFCGELFEMKKQTRLIYRWHCLKFTIVFYRYRHLFAFFPMNWVYSNVEKSQQKRMDHMS